MPNSKILDKICRRLMGRKICSQDEPRTRLSTHSEWCNDQSSGCSKVLVTIDVQRVRHSYNAVIYFRIPVVTQLFLPIEAVDIVHLWTERKKLDIQCFHVFNIISPPSAFRLLQKTNYIHTIIYLIWFQRHFQHYAWLHRTQQKEEKKWIQMN